MKKIHYNKLIRDKIPERIEKDGGEYKTKVLSQGDFERELLKKVEEEASALPKVQSREELVSELADVFDVINEIAKVRGIKLQDILEAQKNNFAKKGGFSKRLFLFWTSDTGYKTNEKKNK